MNDKAEFAVKILHEYAKEQGIVPRSTSDLSPLEEWLILRLFAKETTYRKCPKTSGDCCIPGSCEDCPDFVSSECKGCGCNFKPINK